MQKKSNNYVTILSNNGYTSSENIEQDILTQKRYKLYEDSLKKLSKFCQQILIIFFERNMKIIYKKKSKILLPKELEKLIKEDLTYE